MPEIRRTFTGGRMNKDLDERLVKNGEYRNAVNIQVKTSEGDSDGAGDSGTIQNIQGNTLIGSSYFQNWMISGNDLSNPDESMLPRCVGSIADEKNDKAYFFFASSLAPPDWMQGTQLTEGGVVTALAPHSDTEENNSVERIYVDTIIEQGLNGQTTPIVVDVFGVVNKFVGVMGVVTNWYDSFPVTGWNVIKTLDGSKYRPGMTIKVLNSQGENILPSHQPSLKIRAVDGNNILLHEECYTDIAGGGGGVWFVFEAERVLNFNPGTFLNAGQNGSGFSSSNNYITGINLIDNLLFWTDNYSEPRKINIDRCKAGTNVAGIKNNFRRHTKLYVEHPIDGGLIDAALIDHELDGGGNLNGSGINSFLQLKHITVIRPAPKTPPTLQMKSGNRPGTSVNSFEYIFDNIDSNSGMRPGDSYSITNNIFLSTQFFKNDVLTITENIIIDADNQEPPIVIKAKFVSYENNSPYSTSVSDSLSVTNTIRIKIIDGTSPTPANNNWSIMVEPSPPLFELKLARFGYRYKYEDGEYSAFSPWSEVAFMPGPYKYKPKHGYNLGMVNTVNELIIKDFIPYKKPLDIKSIDILYKTTESPNIYVVDTIEKEKSPQWQLFTPDGSPYTKQIKTGAFRVNSEMIHRVISQEQSLRSWDNVPRRAKAQEIIGNRLIYGNYTQGYNIKEVINLSQEVESVAISNVGASHKSLKSLRDYKVGMVFGDKYGRETPVMTSTYSSATNSIEEFISRNSDISIPKSLSNSSNSIIVNQTWGDPFVSDEPPGWIDYVKYYVKETSSEYYNLVMDRWYPAEDKTDGGSDAIWLSFNSADRNKVDEDTYLVLKNSHGNNLTVIEKARYKILAIKNEAPNTVKTNKIKLGYIKTLTPVTTGSDATAIGGDYVGTVWPNVSDTVTGNAPTLLDSKTTMDILRDTWNSSGIGSSSDINSVFGRDIKGTIQIRVIGANVSDQGVTTGMLKSEWRDLSHYSATTNQIDQEVIRLKWDKLWDEGDVNMFERFTSVSASSDNFDINNLQYWLEIRESITENKPEFEGKFFVKVEKDIQSDSKIIRNTQANTEYNPIATYKLSYIESRSQNQHEMNAPRVNPNTGITVDTTADFGDPTEVWFGGHFNGFISEDDIPYVSAQDNFTGAGGTASVNAAFDDAGRIVTFGNFDAATPTSFQYINVATSAGFDADDADYANIQSQLDDDILGNCPILCAKGDGGPDNYEGMELSPFGSCALNYNLMTQNFWQDWKDDHAAAGSNDSRVFIDGTNSAWLGIYPGVDRERLGYYDWENTGSLPFLGGPDGQLEFGKYARPINVLSAGQAKIGGINDPIVGAQNGTKGSICLSWIWTSQTFDNQGGGSSAFNEYYNVNPPLIQHLREPGTLFRFVDHPDPDAIFKTVGVLYDSTDPLDIGDHSAPFGTTFRGWTVPYYHWGGGGYSYAGNPGTATDIETTEPVYGFGLEGYEEYQDCDNYGNLNFSAIRKGTIYLEFRRIDTIGNISTTGLDTSEFDPRAYLHHDGRDYINIQILSVETDELSGPSTQTDLGAVFETEPKESADVDLYYEASSAIPMKLNESNAFDFAPVGSKVTASRTSSGNTNLITNSASRINHRVGNIYFPNPSTNHAIVSVLSDDVSYYYDDSGTLTKSPSFMQPFLHRRDLAIGDNIYFEHSSGLKTAAVIKELYKPIDFEHGDGTDDNGDYDGIGIDGFKSITTDDIQYGVFSGPKSFHIAGTQAINATVETEGGKPKIKVDATEAAKIEIGDVIKAISQTVDNVDMSVLFGTGSNTAPQGIQVIGLKPNSNDGGTTKIVKLSRPLASWAWNHLTYTEGANMLIIFQKNYGYYGIDIDVWNKPVKLGFHNCWSFGNGVESNRIRDDFNAPTLDNGVKVSTTFSGYGQETMRSGLIYSGLYNSTSQVNNLNEFNMSQKITKELNPSYGSIQRLKTRDTDLITFTEDKVLKILANKDALYNADGNPQLTATDRVLGQAIPFVGDYGISRNPESLAWDQYRMYFTDRQRGAVLRLSRDGLTPISNIGMKNWFRTQLKKTNFALGTFDVVAGEYNLTIKTPANIGVNYKTISFDESTKGWVSFKSFIPSAGLSYSGNYITVKNHQIWKHHVDTTLSGQALERNRFYFSDPEPSEVEVIFNDQPDVIKTFNTINYEGSQGQVNAWGTSIDFYYNGDIDWIDQGDGTYLPAEPFQDIIQIQNNNETFNPIEKVGWHVPLIKTDKDTGKVDEFVEKEGKWFNYISARITGADTITQDTMGSGWDSIQGIGQVNTVQFTGVLYDPNEGGGNIESELCFDATYTQVDCNDATCVDGPCDETVVHFFGCTNETASNYDPNATYDDGSCLYNIQGCMDVDNPNYNSNATIHNGSMCIEVNVGCMDPTATNYDPLATQDGTYYTVDGVDISFIGCYNNCSCIYDMNNMQGNFECSAQQTWDPYLQMCISANYNDICYDENGDLTPCDEDSPNTVCPAGFIWQGDPWNGNCIEQVYGCMDVEALNYAGPHLEYQWPNNNQLGQENTNGQTIDPPANTPCFSVVPGDSEGYDIIQHNTCCEYLVVESLEGCTDPTACNYDPQATWGDVGTWCSWGCVGCMDYANAANYNPYATQPCYGLVNGVYVENGFGPDMYNPNAICCSAEWGDGCTQGMYFCADGTCEEDPNDCPPWDDPDRCDCINDPDPYACYGCMDTTANNYCECCTIDAISPTDMTSPCTYDDHADVYGCTDVTAFNWNSLATIDDGSCVPVVLGCTDDSGIYSNFNPLANTDDGSCELWIYGCMDNTMWNFNPEATTNEGQLCINIIYGCTDNQALNYNPNAHTNIYQVFDQDYYDQTGDAEGAYIYTTEVDPCTYADEYFEVINYMDDIDQETTTILGVEGVGSFHGWLLDQSEEFYEQNLPCDESDPNSDCWTMPPPW